MQAEVDRTALRSFYSAASYRYIEFNETASLAEKSGVGLALTGQVDSYEQGPDLYPNDASDQTFLMVVAPTDVFDGASGGEFVRVMTSAPADASVSDLEAAMPAGSPVALYLNRAVDLPDGVQDPIWAPVSPQGFLTEDDRGVIFPLDGSLNDSDSSMEDEVPEGVDVP